MVPDAIVEMSAAEPVESELQGVVDEPDRSLGSVYPDYCRFSCTSMVAGRSTDPYLIHWECHGCNGRVSV